jgi:hypothetical protein
VAAKPVKPKPAQLLPPRTKTAPIEPEQAFVDPLADVPLLGSVIDRFTIQPGEIEFITVGPIELVIHPSDGEDETEPKDTAGWQAGPEAQGRDLAIATLPAPNFIAYYYLYTAPK